MARGLPGALATNIAQSLVQPFYAVEIDFLSGPLNIWSGVGDIVNGSTTYLGAGQLMNMSEIAETAAIEAKGVSVTLTGIPSTFIAVALDEPYQNIACRIYFGTTNVTTGVNSFYKIFSGTLDQMNILESFNTCSITVTVENALIKLDRPIIRRFTDQDQKLRYPTDRGLEYVANLQNQTIYWGQKKN
jgi:hypothetical protein